MNTQKRLFAVTLVAAYADDGSLKIHDLQGDPELLLALIKNPAFTDLTPPCQHEDQRHCLTKQTERLEEAILRIPLADPKRHTYFDILEKQATDAATLNALESMIQQFTPELAGSHPINPKRTVH